MVASASSGATVIPCAADADCPAAPPCRALRCMSGKCTLADLPLGAPCSAGGNHACDGNGSCALECANDGDCASGACDGHHCAPPCKASWECAPPKYCRSGACVPDEPLGAACSEKAACLSGFCASGVCCDKPCNEGCATCLKSKGASADGSCNEAPKVYAGFVTNAKAPGKDGAGFFGLWSYAGLLGVPAGDAMCKAIGADHACAYHEVLAADAAGQLQFLPKDLSFWLHRTGSVVDPAQPSKSCNKGDPQCGGADICDPTTKLCSFQAGPGARCVDWTAPGGDLADGEWFEVFQNGHPFNLGGVALGTLIYHFDGDAAYDGTLAHTCHDATNLGCAGPCNAPRAVLCCTNACK